MRFSLLYIILLVFVSGLQAASIEGTVKSGEEQLAMAIVLVKETGKVQQADENGYYQISDLLPGTYHLQVSYVGYQTAIRKVQLLENQHLKIHFNLQSQA
ncbi:MAG: carboxypeptidase-like regulatory domain-containing protein, partial [Bacteroidia bacterium]